MANILANLCLDVTQTTVSITISGASETPYYRVYFSHSDTPVARQNATATVSTARKCRVVFWDAEPAQAPSSIFEEPTFIATEIQISFSGGAYELTSAGNSNPWPPT